MFTQGIPFLSKAFTVEFQNDPHHFFQLAHLDIIGRNFELFQLKNLDFFTDFIRASEKALHLFVYRLLFSFEGIELIVKSMKQSVLN